MSIGQIPSSYRGYVGMAKEGSYKAGGAPAYYVDAFSDGFEGDNQTDYQNTTRARENIKGEAGAFDASGSLDLPANPENGIGLLLLACFGSEVFTAQDPDGDSTNEVGKHAYTPAETTPSLAVEVGLDTHVVRYDGVGVDTLEFSHAAEDRLTVSTDLPASEPDSSVNAASPTYSDLRNFWFQDATINLLGADRTADVQDLTATFTNDITRYWRGSRVPDKAGLGQLVAEYEVTVDFENEDIWEAFLGDPTGNPTTPQDTLGTVAFDATWSSAETIDDTTEPYSLQVESPQCIVDTRSANLNENDLIAENVTLTAVKDIGGIGASAQVTLKNGITSAY
jgi:hypothetical protein